MNPMIRKIVWFVLTVLVIGAVCWLLTVAIDIAGIPMPFGKIARVVVMIGGIFAVIFLLLDLVGISWRKGGSDNPLD